MPITTSLAVTSATIACRAVLVPSSAPSMLRQGRFPGDDHAPSWDRIETSATLGIEHAKSPLVPTQ
jgi:hypothetical protein